MAEMNTQVLKMDMVWEEAPNIQRQFIQWRIRNFNKVQREPGVALQSQRFNMLNKTWYLELFPGGLAGSEDWVSLVLTTVKYDTDPDLRVDFSISVVNQCNPAATRKNTAPANTTFPGPMGVQNHTARVGWNEFMKWADMVDPGKGFLVLNELIVEADISPLGKAKGRLVKSQPSELKGSTVSQGIRALYDSKKLADITLTVEGCEFKAHRAVLGSRSKVFEAMFSTPMTEEASNSVQITDVSAETMELMLEFIYTDEIKKANAEPQLIGDLLKAASKYDIPRLCNLCEQRALTAITMDSVVEWLMLATMVEAPLIKSESMRFITGRLAEVQTTAGWSRLLADKQIMSEVMPSILQLLCPPATSNQV